MRGDTSLAEAILSHQQGKHEEAEASYRAVLRKSPQNFTALHHLGVLAFGQNKFDKAHDLITQALTIDGTSSEALNNLGNVLRAQGKPEEAVLSYKRATQMNPNNAGALSNLAIALMDQKKHTEAIAVLENALALDPHMVEAHFNLGNAYSRMHQPEKAIAEYRAAIQIAPSLYPPYVNLGSLLSELGRLSEAADALQKATELQEDPVAFNSLGTCYHRAGRIKEAEDCFRKALELKPDFVEALGNLGLNVAQQGRRDEAVKLARAALRLNPDFPPAVSNLFFEQRHLCDWQDFEANEMKLRELAREGARISPFAFITANTPPDEQLMCARNWAAHLPPQQFAFFSPALRRPGRIRIGYLSSDFKEHATAFLMAEMLERHDRQRFEILAYSYSTDDGSEVRRRLLAAFDHFIDIRAMPHEAAIRKIRDDGVDILVDLKGYTQDARTEIMVGRPAPIQVAYLGYPGTMGARCIDYMIADHFVVPADQRQHFSEKLVYLPHCYQPNDTKRTVSSLGFTRSQFGLPEDGFVFCSFNGNYKITPTFFDAWMRLLKSTPGSVLWLLETGTRVHLLREANARGVAPERIIFAQGLVHSQHLERMALADLFLDSLPVNAHTTASDALWAGLPLLTCAGIAFIGRVAGSILHAVGLPELVTASLEEYEAKALHLAQNPGELRALRDRLARNKLTSPLFDIARFTRNLETAYQMMWDRWQAGHAPDTISVPEKGLAPPPAPAFSLAEAQAARLKVAPVVERIFAYAGEGCWLDVDNGDPTLMLAASEWGYTPVCINSRPEIFSTFQELGFETHAEDIASLEQAGRFRVISLTNFASLHSPAGALHAARNLLAENGILFVSTTDTGSPLWRLVGQSPDAAEGKPFTRASLRTILEEHGFTPTHFAASALHPIGVDVIALKST
jgi:predicted O-linked N-acetylglucosamine transferase (SPINDLY family)